MIPQGGLDGSVICYCSITLSLVFEILWFLKVDWMGL